MTRHEYIAQAIAINPRGTDLPHARLCPDRVRYIRRNPLGRTAKQLAAELGVHWRTIDKVRRFETWRHVL